ncbi:hypothetical protein [Winogradskyella sp. UBA3174]|uniref:hypothetical protein n=1 Tax=Winogradskyella sp. UBA3174 TaxID=1947785 RepID=UPI0025E52799|nr:hypothetical protein [Winogradskyella sp. UBA3174]|tara:strand:+ start:103155 stop:103850 length:696 start_codon:yes stop_codon:yes gene_type:complete
MALRNDMQVLIKSIRQPILFFLPRQVFEEVTKKDLTNLEKLGLLNTLFITNSMGESKPIIHCTELLQILEKPKIFKSNVFELLELRNTLDKSAFHYLIDDYFKELSTWIRTTDIICEEAKNHVINFQPEMQGYLKLQYDTLIDHQIELKRHFGKWKSHFEFRRLLNFNDKNFDKVVTSIKDSTPIKLLETKNKKVKPVNVKPKSIPISEIEADQYILKSIFNVDFTKINIK